MAWTNEVSGRVDGPVVQVGVVVGDVRVGEARSVRSAYLAQVRALAPGSIVGRYDELAVLAAFCSSEVTAEGYLWWRAEAWSGKSALLSWFVLHPPAGVRVVSFFVTSQLPGQNDRRGFVDSVLDQLDERRTVPGLGLTEHEPLGPDRGRRPDDGSELRHGRQPIAHPSAQVFGDYGAAR